MTGKSEEGRGMERNNDLAGQRFRIWTTFQRSRFCFKDEEDEVTPPCR